LEGKASDIDRKIRGSNIEDYIEQEGILKKR